MTDPKTVAERYISLWNTTDSDGRRRQLADGWSTDARYADPQMAGRGHAEIEALIAGVHAAYPGFVFTLYGTPDGHGPHVRFSWSLGPEGAEPLARGTDHVELEGDGIARVTGFLDLVPQAA